MLRKSTSGAAPIPYYSHCLSNEIFSDSLSITEENKDMPYSLIDDSSVEMIISLQFDLPSVNALSSFLEFV